jgi:hypothetical protein
VDLTEFQGQLMLASTFEEAQVARRPGFLTVAVLLTVLNVAVNLSYGWPVWSPPHGEVWNLMLAVLLATLGVLSLINLWAQVAFARNDHVGVESVVHSETVPLVPVLARGHADV